MHLGLRSGLGGLLFRHRCGFFGLLIGTERIDRFLGGLCFSYFSFAIIGKKSARLIVLRWGYPLQRVLSIGVWSKYVVDNFIGCLPRDEVIRN